VHEDEKTLIEDVFGIFPSSGIFTVASSVSDIANGVSADLVPPRGLYLR
jgi:hypothetical protein